MASKKKKPVKPNSIQLAAQALALGYSEREVNSADSIKLWAMAQGAAPRVPAAPAPQAPAPQAPAPQQPAYAPPIRPFLTAEQQKAASDELGQIDDGIYNLQRQYQDLDANTQFEITNTNKREQESNAAAVENMIARGLFRSSIKDSELADVAGSALARRTFLTTTLDTARIDRDTRISKLNERKRENFGADMGLGLGGGGFYDEIAAQNAQNIEPVPLPTTPGVSAGPLKGADKAAPTQKTVGVQPVKNADQQSAANAFATRNAQEQAKAATAVSRSRKIAKPKAPKKPRTR